MYSHFVHKPCSSSRDIQTGCVCLDDIDDIDDHAASSSHQALNYVPCKQSIIVKDQIGMEMYIVTDGELEVFPNGIIEWNDARDHGLAKAYLNHHMVTDACTQIS